MTAEDEMLLTIAVQDAARPADGSALASICEIEGSVVPDGRPPFTVLEEALKLLEMCADKYNTPRPNGKHLMVVIGQKRGGDTKPLARLDILITDGLACASFVFEDVPSAMTESIAVDTEDDVTTIVRKVLEQHLSQ